MKEIAVEHQPSEQNLRKLGVFGWPIWTKEVSEFPWSYDERKTCYLMEGDVEVMPDGGKPVRFGKGGLITFPQGMSCVWKVRKDVRKHYQFG